MKIGVFDSGVGGLSVAQAVQAALPDIEIIYREDHEHIPYGAKTADELEVLVTPILQAMVSDGCELIVLACNTVSTTIAERVTKAIPVPLVAVEPMIEAAVALTKTKVIAVCATPATLGSARYKQLVQTHAADCTVVTPDCGDWAVMIEAHAVDLSKIGTRMQEVILVGADVIVLGCTHYHWIEDEILRLADGRARVVQPEADIVRRVQAFITAR